jgi:hypothetical protein
MRNYFQLANSFYGEVYFRVSKHLGWLPSEVIKKKFLPDVKFLIMKYSQQIHAEVKRAEEIKEKEKELSY